jgi:hypothetical protein
MARALMTPDELRRMDNDLCIIFEKGIKPIKANKYYYFKYPEGKIVDRYKADHNDVMIERGPWRIFNPNNPYEESNGENESFPSLDSLFEDDSTAGTVTSAPKTGDNIDNSTSVFDSLPGLGEPASVASKVTQPAPQTESKPKATTDIDIQKELEAKFDELFGALDDEDE